MKKNERKKPSMIVEVIQDGTIINTLNFKGIGLVRKMATYLSGAYGEIENRWFKIEKDHSTTFGFDVVLNNVSSCIFRSTIANFDYYLL